MKLNIFSKILWDTADHIPTTVNIIDKNIPNKLVTNGFFINVESRIVKPIKYVTNENNENPLTK